MFNRILLSASIAGLLAALALTAAQFVWISPLIQQAEIYEDAAPAHAEAHDHDHAWQPEDGWQRTLFTGASNAVMGIGFALILCGVYTLRQPSGASQGLSWGLAGYVVFFAAPALGLPPDLPGAAVAELSARQYWWLGTAAATATGLGLIFLQPRYPFKIIGALLLAIPHLIGAPRPVSPLSLSPEELQTQFRLIAIFTNALFWLLLGVLSAVVFRRLARLSGER